MCFDQGRRHGIPSVGSRGTIQGPPSQLKNCCWLPWQPSRFDLHNHVCAGAASLFCREGLQEGHEAPVATISHHGDGKLPWRRQSHRNPVRQYLAQHTRTLDLWSFPGFPVRRSCCEITDFFFNQQMSWILSSEKLTRSIWSSFLRAGRLMYKSDRGLLVIIWNTALGKFVQSVIEWQRHMQYASWYVMIYMIASQFGV